MNDVRKELLGLVGQLESLSRALYERLQSIDDPDFLLALGEEIADKPEHAVRFFDRVIALRPHDLQAVLDAGACYLLAGNDLDAYYMLRRARQLAPTDPEVKKLEASVCSP